MKNSDSTTITVSPTVSYVINDFVKTEGKYFTIIGVDPAHTTLTLKSWRWYHYAYYRTKWWILERVHAVKDFWGRVLCGKGMHSWHDYHELYLDKERNCINEGFPYKERYLRYRGFYPHDIFKVRVCKRCELHQVSIFKPNPPAHVEWVSFGSITIKNLWDKLERAERVYDQED